MDVCLLVEGLKGVSSPEDRNKALENILNAFLAPENEEMTEDLASTFTEKGLLDDLVAIATDPAHSTIVAQILAEVAKEESVRETCVEKGFVPVFLRVLEQNEDLQGTTQACRALGNMCFDNGNPAAGIKRSFFCLPNLQSVNSLQTFPNALAKKCDLVFALIIANSQLVTLVRMRKYFLHPMDLHIIINLVNSAESFKAAESWTPICLPKFDSSGFLQAHISYLDEECQTCLLLLSVDRESFFPLSECRNRIRDRLIKYNGLKAIHDSLRRDSYNIQKCGISDLRHFLYKNKSTAQYTSPELEAPYLQTDQQERLFGLYYYLHHRIHSISRPLKILYHVGQYEALLGWVTQGFELYAVFGPLVTKPLAINAINKLMAWIRKEQHRLFILDSVTF